MIHYIQNYIRKMTSLRAPVSMSILSWGSTPLGSTTSPRTAYRSRRLFCKSHLSLILSRLLSESNPLCWASIRFCITAPCIFFLSIHAGLRLFGEKIWKTVLPWISKAKSAANPHERGFRLIFQAGGPAFLRSAAFSPPADN